MMETAGRAVSTNKTFYEVWRPGPQFGSSRMQNQWPSHFSFNVLLILSIVADIIQASARLDGFEGEENQNLGKFRPMLASKWISSRFGHKETSETSSLHSAFDPLSSAAHRRGEYLDHVVQFLGQGSSSLPSATPIPRTKVDSMEVQTLDGDYLIHPSPFVSYLISIYYPDEIFEDLWFKSELETLFRQE
jgi:hypothetical protein